MSERTDLRSASAPDRPHTDERLGRDEHLIGQDAKSGGAQIVFDLGSTGQA